MFSFIAININKETDVCLARHFHIETISLKIPELPDNEDAVTIKFDKQYNFTFSYLIRYLIIYIDGTIHCLKHLKKKSPCLIVST